MVLPVSIFLARELHVGLVRQSSAFQSVIGSFVAKTADGQSKVPIVLPHSGMLPQISLKDAGHVEQESKALIASGRVRGWHRHPQRKR